MPQINTSLLKRIYIYIYIYIYTNVICNVGDIVEGVNMSGALSNAFNINC